MVAEAWILKMGNQVSSNLGSALLSETSKKKELKSSKTTNNKQIVGILSFEVANLMSKTIHLHKSLIDSEISKLKKDILSSEGVRNLVSSDEAYLLELALTEKLEELNRVAGVVSRLGKRCTEPPLQGFEHVYSDIVSGVIDVKELGFLVKDMDGMVKKMERYVNATANLYSEIEVLNELEQAMKKFQYNQHEESKRAFEQKFIWQKQDVEHLKEISLWNQTYNKVVELLARAVCTVYARICLVLGDSVLKRNASSLIGRGSPLTKDESKLVSGQIGHVHPFIQMGSEPLKLKRRLSRRISGQAERHVAEKRLTSFKPQLDSGKVDIPILRHEVFNFPCGTSPSRLFMDCLSLKRSISKFDEEDGYVDSEGRSGQISGCCSVSNGGFRMDHPNHSCSFNGRQVAVLFSGDQGQLKSGMMNDTISLFGPRSRLSTYAPPSTVGGSALALHYANVVIVIEKLLRYPHLVGEEARDDLYQMLPTSLRTSLKTQLKAYIKNLAIYDAPLAHSWKETLDGILRWLSPLAHNMIRWQSERNFEQHQIVSRTNVLLLQTLYFADREKTEAAICELLVGLNYICRYEHQQNALLDCASSFDFEDCMEWQMQCKGSYIN